MSIGLNSSGRCLFTGLDHMPEFGLRAGGVADDILPRWLPGAVELVCITLSESCTFSTLSYVVAALSLR